MHARTRRLGMSLINTLVTNDDVITTSEVIPLSAAAAVVVIKSCARVAAVFGRYHRAPRAHAGRAHTCSSRVYSIPHVRLPTDRRMN